MSKGNIAKTIDRHYDQSAELVSLSLPPFFVYRRSSTQYRSVCISQIGPPILIQLFVSLLF